MFNKITRYKHEIDLCFQELQPVHLESAIIYLKRARHIFIIGNGGSASTAAHIAVDFVKAGLPAVALVEPSQVTAFGNDSGYNSVFVEQLKVVMAHPGDLLLAISASGDSPNILEAVKYAKRNSRTTIGLSGFGGGKLDGQVDLGIPVSSKNYGVIEDFHLSLGHIISQHIRGIK